VVSLLVSVIPPTTFTCSFSFFLMTAPVSPPYFMPSFRVATSSLVPSGFSYTIRVVVVPGAPSTPGLPSLVTEMFVVWPSLPLIPILPFLPSLPAATIVSVFRFLSILTVRFPFESAKVLMFSPEYSEAAFVPSPLMVTLSPKFRWNSPSLPAKSMPLFVSSVDVLVILLSTSLSWSSVAACPLVMLFGSQVLLVSPLTVPSFPLIFTFPASMFPVVPSMVTLSPALMMPVVPSMDTCLAGSLPSVTLFPSPIVYSVPPAALVPSVTVTLASLALTVVCWPASVFTSCSWLPLTASVLFALTSPAATLVILLPPLLRPFLVRDTGFPAAPLLIVTPLLFITVSPVVTLSRPFRALARRTFRLLLPSDTTPRLSSVVSLLVSVIPPTTFTCSFSFFLMTAPVSPPYFMPSFKVATSSLVPSGFSYTIRVVVVPGAPSTPGLPSRVTEMFVVWPSLPLMPIFPSLPFSPVATTVSAFRFLFIFTSIVVFPAGSCVIKVLRFSPL